MRKARDTTVVAGVLEAAVLSSRKHSGILIHVSSMVASQGCAIERGPDLAAAQITVALCRTTKEISAARDALPGTDRGLRTPHHWRRTRANKARLAPKGRMLSGTT
jgi:hypothetical protein